MVKLVWALVLLAGVLARADKVRDGPSVTIEEYPSLAQVEIRLGLLWVSQCGANILTRYHILTVGYCFYGQLYYPENRRIRAGTSVRGSGGIIDEVRYANVHPNYGQLDKDSDIAVVELINPLPLDGITLAQVAIFGQGIDLPTGLEVLHVGWGTTAEGGEVSDYYLSTINLVVSNRQACLSRYYALDDEESKVVTENMFCLGTSLNQGRDFDNRDVGAPVYYDNFLAGILSFGRRENDEYPVVATSVSAFSDWIVEQAQGLS